MPTGTMVGGKGYKKKEDNLSKEMRCYMDQVVKQQVVEQLAREKAREKKKEKLYRDDIPEFQGSIQPKEFLDWLGVVDKVFTSKEVPEKKKVSLVATRLRGHALAWWRQTKSLRERQGKKMIDSWDKMKKHMRAGFLPHNYAWTVTQQADESHYEAEKKTVEEVVRRKRVKLRKKVMWIPLKYDYYFESNCEVVVDREKIVDQEIVTGVEGICDEQSLKEDKEVDIEQKKVTWFCEEDIAVKRVVGGELILPEQQGVIVDFIGAEIFNYKIDKKLINFVNWLKFVAKKAWLVEFSSVFLLCSSQYFSVWSGKIQCQTEGCDTDTFLIQFYGNLFYKGGTCGISEGECVVCLLPVSNGIVDKLSFTEVVVKGAHVAEFTEFNLYFICETKVSRLITLTGTVHVIQVSISAARQAPFLMDDCRLQWNRKSDGSYNPQGLLIALNDHMDTKTQPHIESPVWSCFEAAQEQTRIYGVEGAGTIVNGLALIWFWMLHNSVDHHMGLTRILYWQHDFLRGVAHAPLLVTHLRQVERSLDAFQRLGYLLSMAFISCQYTTRTRLNAFKGASETKKEFLRIFIRKGEMRESVLDLVAQEFGMQSYWERPTSPGDNNTVLAIFNGLQKMPDKSGLGTLVSIPIMYRTKELDVILKNDIGRVVLGLKLVRLLSEIKPYQELELNFKDMKDVRCCVIFEEEEEEKQVKMCMHLQVVIVELPQLLDRDVPVANHTFRSDQLGRNHVSKLNTLSKLFTTQLHLTIESCVKLLMGYEFVENHLHSLVYEVFTWTGKAQQKDVKVQLSKSNYAKCKFGFQNCMRQVVEALMLKVLSSIVSMLSACLLSSTTGSLRVVHEMPRGLGWKTMKIFAANWEVNVLGSRGTKGIDAWLIGKDTEDAFSELPNSMNLLRPLIPSKSVSGVFLMNHCHERLAAHVGENATLHELVESGKRNKKRQPQRLARQRHRSSSFLGFGFDKLRISQMLKT